MIAPIPAQQRNLKTGEKINSDTVKPVNPWKQVKADKAKTRCPSPSAQKAADDAEFGPMPDYDKEPAQWILRIRARMAGALRKRGIVQNEVVGAMLREVIQDAGADKKLGNERYCLAALNRRIRAHRKQKARHADSFKRQSEIARLEIIARQGHVQTSDFELICKEFITSRDAPNYVEAEARIRAKCNGKEPEMPRGQKVTPPDPVPPSQANPMEATIATNAAEIARAHAAADAKAAEPKTATEWDTFDKTNGHKPIAERSHDKQRAIFEVAEHLKKVYVYPGQHVRAIFDCSTEEAITKLGIDKVWAEIYAYEDEHPSDKPVDAPTQPAPETTVEPANGAAQATTPAAAADERQAGESGEKGKETVTDKPTEQIIDKAQFRKERTINISGQKYLKAGDRVVMFRADHPDWSLETEAVQLLPDFAVFKAWIKDSGGKTVSTAHGYCTPDLAKKVSGRFVEKAETAAIARALALAGYGTDDTLDDSDYLSDSPVSKAA